MKCRIQERIANLSKLILGMKVTLEVAQKQIQKKRLLRTRRWNKKF